MCLLQQNECCPQRGQGIDKRLTSNYCNITYMDILQKMLMRIGYVFSTVSDGEKTDREMIEKHFSVRLDKVYLDQLDERPNLTECFLSLNPGDIVYVNSLCEISSDMRVLIYSLREIYKAGASLQSVNDASAVEEINRQTTDDTLRLLSSFLKFTEGLKGRRSASYGSLLNLERNRGGGQYVMTPERIEYALKAIRSNEDSFANLAIKMGVTRQTLYRYISPRGELRADAIRCLKSI